MSEPTREERIEAIPAVQLGIMGPGKALYESHRSEWAKKQYGEHPLPEWSKLTWQALAVWNSMALSVLKELAEARERATAAERDRDQRTIQLRTVEACLGTFTHAAAIDDESKIDDAILAGILLMEQR